MTSAATAPPTNGGASAPSAIPLAPGDPATPPRASHRRRILTWIVIGIVVVGVGSAGAVLSNVGRWSERDALDPESAGPSGSRALVEILREHGVEVVVARDRAAATAALVQSDATLALTDAPALSDEGLSEIIAAADAVVLLDPRQRSLRVALGGGTTGGGTTGGRTTGGVGSAEAVNADCENPTARRAGPVAPGVALVPENGMLACYPTGDGFGLIGISRPGTATGFGAVAIDGRALFTNEHLADNGNAALAVGLLGAAPRLVWYSPGPADTDLETGDPTLGELTPPWVSPVIVLLLLAALAAAIWRGRRFGPLVRERLPVTVRAGETTEGRARLYARTGDALHAADQLRIGALARLARLLGLGASASVDEIADAAASTTGADRGAARAALVDEEPENDAALVALAERLRSLEDGVRASVRSGRNPR